MSAWDITFLAGFLVYVGIRAVFERRTNANVAAVDRSQGDRVLLLLVAIGNVLLPVLYLATPWLAFADIAPPPAVPWCGVPVLLLALWLFWRAHRDLGRNWSVTVRLRQGHELVTTGVYQRVRHPMYAAILLFGLAQGLLLANWLAGWAALATFAVMYVVRTPREERMMLEHFGADYRDYMARSGRLWPARARRAGPGDRGAGSP